MVENVLKNCSVKVKVTVKSAISVALVLSAAFLPLLFHSFAGAKGGAVWLPMFIPALIGGCVLGSVFGGIIGVMSPVASFFISNGILGANMPTVAMLPYMMIEVAIFGIVAGVFSKKIAVNSLYSFPAVIVAQISGRIVNLIINSIVIAISGVGQIGSALYTLTMGLPGLYLQVALVPLIIIILSKAIKNDRNK